MAKDILTAPIGTTHKEDGVFTPNPVYVAEQADKKDTQAAIQVLRYTVQSFANDKPTDQQLIDRLDKVWNWWNT